MREPRPSDVRFVAAHIVTRGWLRAYDTDDDTDDEFCVDLIDEAGRRYSYGCTTIADACEFASANVARGEIAIHTVAGETDDIRRELNARCCTEGRRAPMLH